MQPVTITQSKINYFSLPFTEPLVFGGQTMTHRVGFYLEVISSEGYSAKGEIAPLPGFSAESIKKAEHDLNQFQPLFPDWHVPITKSALMERIHNDYVLSSLSPSVRFGIESVFFILASRRNQQNLAQFLGAVSDETSSSVLLQGTHEQVLEQARQMKAHGAGIYKLKVGDRNITLDVKKVKDLRSVIGPDAAIRLDANGAWSLKEAILFAQLAGLEQIEFIEEPLNDMAGVQEFYQVTRMPVALDDTLKMVRCGVRSPGRCSPTLAMQEGVKAFVIKPTILGGVVAALDWIEEARRLEKKPIISSAYESSVGLTVLQALACFTGQTPGLGTQRWFK